MDKSALLFGQVWIPVYPFRPISILVCLAVFMVQCKSPAPPRDEPQSPEVADTVRTQIDYDTSKWTELTFDQGFALDIRYATDNNFVHEAIYPCGRCFLRPAVARALTKANQQLKDKGYALKLFDCYRPRPAQQILWNKVPNADYVAPPAEGSMHNRGSAIDLTLTDPDGHDIDMGTTYDFFGPEAHQDYTRLPEQVLTHRKLLTTTMQAFGFQSIRTEWWHFSFGGPLPPLEDWEWPCR